MAFIEVAAAIIEQRGKFLITRRTASQHLAGHWEFPGGKRRRGESWKRCLARELREELGVIAQVGKRFAFVEHQYPEKSIRIAFYRSRILAGSPRALEGQDARWVSRRGLSALRFPEADDAVVRKLTRVSAR